MSILVDEDTTFIIQGITGREAVMPWTTDRRSRAGLTLGRAIAFLRVLVAGPEEERLRERTRRDPGGQGRTRPLGLIKSEWGLEGRSKPNHWNSNLNA